jgi:hypothetical protein
MQLTDEFRITKLMGESFKIHAQALVGYEDPVEVQSGSPTPSVNPPHIRALDMQTAY